jgi:hydroxymethylglutaryl-CoA lyase
MAIKTVNIIEVGPRDGLQSESRIMSTTDKVEFIRRLVGAGLRKIEVASFVHPGRVPQMADAEQVLAAIPRRQDLTYIGLALNERGVERAIEAGVDELGFVVIASDTFNRRNQGVGTEDSMAAWARVAGMSNKASLAANITISAAFGCPFEGAVAQSRVVELAQRVMESEPSELALADTIGVATPWQVRELLGKIRPIAGNTPIRCHFHNTRNTGIANAFAAIEAGADSIDASTGGIGGCPFAPAATGNIATEDLVYMLRHSGIEINVSLPELLDTAKWLGDTMGLEVPGMLSRAGDFPSQNIAAAE